MVPQYCLAFAAELKRALMPRCSGGDDYQLPIFYFMIVENRVYRLSANDPRDMGDDYVRTHLVSVLFCLAAILLFSTARAQVGGVIVRVPDGAASRCIDGRKDTVWLTLRRLRTTKTNGWLTQGTGVSVVINATVRQVRTNPALAKPLSFPLMADASFEQAPPGQVSLPVEYTIIDTLALFQQTGTPNDAVRYSGFDIDLTLLNKNKENTWGKGLQALSTFAKKFPLPTNPAIQAATYVLDIANSAIASDIKQQSSDALKTASLTINFDKNGPEANGQCHSKDFESTGTLAAVMDAGLPGFIRTADVELYCWAAELKPSFILKAGRRTAVGVDCAVAANHQPFTEVPNNYVGFVLSAETTTTNLAGPPRSDVDAAEARCKANGLSYAACR